VPSSLGAPYLDISPALGDEDREGSLLGQLIHEELVSDLNEGALETGRLKLVCSMEGIREGLERTTLKLV
jgi:hypothetical protein